MRKILSVVAILDTMYGVPGDAPAFFRINPDNHSGRRLYKLIGDNGRLVVTNACREQMSCANDHGTPDHEWLAENLARRDALKRIDLLLVCGNVAQKAYARCGWKPITECKVIEMPHPAARQWTRDSIKSIQEQIARIAESKALGTASDLP